MVSIISIIVGFMALLAAECYYLRTAATHALKYHRLFQDVGYFFVALGIVVVVMQELNASRLSLFMQALFIILAIKSGILLIWTTFIEIPRGVAKYHIQPGHVYNRGSYGKCRHPGFWWFLFFTLWLTLWANTRSALESFLVSNTMNLLLIFVQDKYTFPAQFSDYRQYTINVPFLIPKSSTLRKR